MLPGVVDGESHFTVTSFRVMAVKDCTCHKHRFSLTRFRNRHVSQKPHKRVAKTSPRYGSTRPVHQIKASLMCSRGITWVIKSSILILPSMYNQRSSALAPSSSTNEPFKRGDELERAGADS